MRTEGIVKHYNAKKGIGFIGRDGESDVFFHVSNVLGDTVRTGHLVEYTLDKNDRGYCAIEIKILDSNESQVMFNIEE